LNEAEDPQTEVCATNHELIRSHSNNVNLSEDKRLQRALEKWLPNFLSWWHDMGPEGFQQKDVWLRTAVDVGSEGWAHFDYVKMPDYRWGIFSNRPRQTRRSVSAITTALRLTRKCPASFVILCAGSS
jgi:hypothetical protein